MRPVALMKSFPPFNLSAEVLYLTQEYYKFMDEVKCCT